MPPVLQVVSGASRAAPRRHVPADGQGGIRCSSSCSKGAAWSVLRASTIQRSSSFQVLVGEKCERIMAEKVRNVQVRDVECDELWNFLGKKQKRVRPEDDSELGRPLRFRRC